MFQDLDATLRQILADATAPADVRNAEVSFDTPDRDYKPTVATVNLFLHDVSENRSLRDDARVMDKAGDLYSSRLPALRIECTYLATAWSAKTAGLKTQEEHSLLGQSLAWLSRWPVIDSRFLQGSLLSPLQPYAVPMVVAQVKEGHSMGEFWNALGITPRPAFSLAVTMTMQINDQVDQFPAAKQFQVQSTQLSQPLLTGRVLDHTLAPVPSAQVTVVGTGMQTTVGPTGAFAFGGLTFGLYTLLVQAPQQADIQASVDYVARGQIHNVIIPGP